MSKKHFKALAEAIRCARPSLSSHPANVVYWADMAKRIADVCAEVATPIFDRNGNRRFDRNRFLTACGLTADER